MAEVQILASQACVVLVYILDSYEVVQFWFVTACNLCNRVDDTPRYHCN